MVAHAEALRQPFDGLRDWPAQPAASPLRGGRTPLGSLDNIALTYVENKAPQTSASWLSGGPFQCQIVPQAAPSFGQPRPISRLGRAGRPYRPCFSHRYAPVYR